MLSRCCTRKTQAGNAMAQPLKGEQQRTVDILGPAQKRAGNSTWDEKQGRPIHTAAAGWRHQHLD